MEKSGEQEDKVEKNLPGNRAKKAKRSSIRGKKRNSEDQFRWSTIRRTELPERGLSKWTRGNH